ncbi:hypothetical protein PN465_09765 [Nodularia spumigena CS-584]|jgi:hypothetical protein|uniref:Succinoglycan biosynthesis protein exoi n=1 Tax=Nodularia spumigena UHCC 0060 TaxID=3110300 RepID=A0ABU5UPG9_NODSP|nr:hypothetical protein [Nodularia spumigena]EAW44238.1 hypothetical protein N9414_12368 [Nodularia spumigena CCY9414]MDB9382508.1 hypothetical protein [Nodularia spumigena CS-584]MEA5523835.1 hypothetical protein [Nodularia spumigena UHCC 0143]MEA5555799.1 hypothetical protein [Nodularia spumigena CH309]MEA5608156.1 hypothetical protein [Nodularia spumigena UHCC 0060]
MEPVINKSLGSTVFIMGIVVVLALLTMKSSPRSSASVIASIKTPKCTIKGNISMKTGSKIYHLPGMKYYESTVINPAVGERWFCTESEAIANGWRKSRR